VLPSDPREEPLPAVLEELPVAVLEVVEVALFFKETNDLSVVY
jgi:hypothetical protein